MRSSETTPLCNLFDDHGAFPWWVLRPTSEPVAVVEDVQVVKVAKGYSALLDAQYLGGNDLIISVPVGTRLMQKWGCAGEAAVVATKR